MVAQSGFTHNSQLQELIARGQEHAAKLNAQIDADNAQRVAEWQAETNRHLNRLIDAGELPAWMREYCAFNPGDLWQMTIHLPGCAPISAAYGWHGDSAVLRWHRVTVAEPVELEFSPTLKSWYVHTRMYAEPHGSNFAQIVAIAAYLGESYWEMRREADRRNAAGETPQQEPPTRVTLPDLYRRAYNAAIDADIDSDGVICALLAVAAEIRSLRVALTESQVPL